jgi:Haem-binding domain/Cytochrome P460
MKSLSHKKWFRIFIVIVALFFIGIQFTTPHMDYPPVTVDIAVPDSVKNILRKACFDCHSNETKLSWFDKVAPASWLVADHIHEGRAAFNFSNFGNLSKDQQIAFLFTSLNQMQFGVMPLRQYTFVHPSAKINAKEAGILQSYLNTLIKAPAPDTAKARMADDQYNKWIAGSGITGDIKPMPNGITFMPGYKNWVAVSTTERTENGTMRVIMGNDIAVNAIRKNHSKPWPDGSAFAKIVWTQLSDTAGNIRTGEFRQVDFMIKNASRYRSTAGWGFARWNKGIQLAVYSANMLFATECVNCHLSMKDNDFIFTEPISLITEHALDNKVIASFINKEEGSMSTLYGNEIATNFARTHSGSDYPAGSVLTLNTWIQRKDLHWFGANIPGEMKAIEKILFIESGNGIAQPAYEQYAGVSLKKIETNNLKDVNDRMNFILSQRASVLP